MQAVCVCSCAHCCWQRQYGAAGWSSNPVQYSVPQYAPVMYPQQFPVGNATPVPPAEIACDPPAAAMNSPSFVSPELVQIFANSNRKRKHQKERGSTRKRRKQNSSPLAPADDIKNPSPTPKVSYGTYSKTVLELESQMDADFDTYELHHQPIAWPHV
uniref:Uncharacterized protein n=1 Tax=Vannella robusta TaxID=1487602 RepID=A0A7S4I271_9EUKA|mmetsp:Transcript_19400/g.24518  ORF Transcript_19400/g.24518 Transcript_19400/m.24518 type:complete len:158 (+) Transcript_19400:31-504(+)